MEQAGLRADLAGFGLSRYESAVYMELVERGPLSAGALGLYAGIPRTKVYPTIRKLGRMGLVVALPGRPLSVRAANPRNLLESLLVRQQTRLESMRSEAQAVQKIFDKSELSLGVTDGQYLRLHGYESVLSTLSELLKAREGALCLVDLEGLRLLTTAQEHVAGRSASKLLILSEEPLHRGSLGGLHIDSEVRFAQGEQGASFVLFERGNSLLLDTKTGSGILIDESTVSQVLYTRAFAQAWARASAGPP